MAARLVTWITRSSIAITPYDVHMVRMLGMTLLPPLSGAVSDFCRLAMQLCDAWK
jgi:hypothetical protein